MAYIGNTPESTLSINTKEYTATEGQTTFSAVYGESVRVYMNGLLLASSDYTATDGFTVVLNVGATAGDIIRIDGYADIATVSGVVTSVAGKTGNVTLYTGDVVGLDTTLNTKQDILVSGVDIKTVNGNDLLGSGNIKLAVGTDIIEVSSNTTMQISTHYVVRSKGISLTLPNNAVVGDKVIISTNMDYVTILRNGYNIGFLAEDLIVDVLNTTVELQYINLNEGWRII